MKRLWKKRLLALFLSVSMLLTLIPSAFALGDEGGNSGPNNGLTWKQVDNSAVSAPIGREEIEEPEVKPLYDDSEEVRVSIVLEEEPTLARFSMDGKGGLSSRAKAYREGLRNYQADAAAYISEAVLDDEPLDVVWNLTLVANIISANVKYGEIEDIKALDGVEDVIVETRYEIQGFPVEADPQMVISTGMTHTTQTWDTGYTGAGMRIAIIDTGLDIEHQSFDNAAFLHALGQDAEEAGKTLSDYDLLDADEIAGVLDELNANIDTVTADDLYYNEKLPFCFNYVDENLDVTHWNDSQGEHGSHVAGIAAANRYVSQGGKFVKAMETNGVFMCGDAPDAQVLVMKVFGKGGGAWDSDYFAAIEDAIILNCDTVNLSLGSGSAGLSFASGKYQEIMDGLVETNTVVTMSAGNNSYWAEQTYVGFPYSDDVNFHTNSSPGSYTNSLAVASVDNNGMVAPGLITAFDKTMTYTENDFADELATLDPDGTGTDYEFVYVDTIGGMYDFWAVDVEGKIAMCNRGETDFSEKALNAVDVGAIAVIICNNQAGTINMDLSDYADEGLTAPVVSITLDNAEYIKDHAVKTTADTLNEETIDVYTGTLTITGAMAAIPGTADYLTMSEFSSWGVPGDLSLKPEITAPGGNIWSLNGLGEEHDAYESMSGTSMAAPQMAGIGALVKQSIEERGYSAKTDITDRALVQSLMMSTAIPLKDADENYYPVFQQGAGLVDTLAAVNADSYILMSSDATPAHNDGKVKVELGDDPDRTGRYDFTFTINNLKDVPLSYTLDAEVFTQAYEYNDESAHYHLMTYTKPLENADFDYTVVSATAGVSGTKYDFDGNGVVDENDGNALLDFVTGKRQSISHQENADMSSDGQVSSYDGYVFLQNGFASSDTVNVPANGSVTIRATIGLDQDEMAEIMECCPNGVYVEAYVKVNTVANEEGALGTSHSIPVLGFYGNWTDPSMYERGNALDYAFDLEKGDEDAFFETLEKNGYPYLFDGTPTSVYANRLMYQKAGEKGAYYFGGNPYTSDDEYLPGRNALSSVSGDKISRWNYMAIRNAAAGRVLIRDTATDDVYMELPLGDVTAAFYYAGTGSWMSTGYAASINWAGTDRDGQPLPEGTEVELSLTLAPELYVDGDQVNWDALGKGASQTMILAIDNTAPELKNAEYDGTTKTLSITVKDNRYTAYAAITNADGTRILDAKSPNQALDDKGKEITLDFDMSNVVGKEFNVVLGDYANNRVTYRLEGEFDPNMDLTPDIDAYYYGYNQWSGEWVAYTKDGTEFAVVGYGLNTEKGDLENAFITAGAYAEGYVFAIDDQHNFYAFAANKDLPLIGDGQWIAQLDGIGQVYDMAYDGTDMYLSYESYVYVPGDDFGGIGDDDDFGVALNSDDDDFGGYGDDDFGGIGDDETGTQELVVMLGKIDLMTGEITEIDQLSDDDRIGYAYALAFDDSGNLYELEYCEFWDENDESESTSVLNKLDVSAYLVTKNKVADVEAAGDSFNWMAWDSNDSKLVLSVGENNFGYDVAYDFITNIYTVDPQTGDAELAIALTENEHQLTAMFVDPDPDAETIPDSTEAIKVTLSETSLYMAPGNSETLTAVVAPWNLTNKALTWSSSDPAVVAVDQSGTIRTLSPGTAVITVTSAATPGVKATCEVEVAKLDQELNALIWTDHVDWASFPVTEPDRWTAIQESDKVFASAIMGEDGYIYAATLDDDAFTSDLYRVDPTTYKSTLLGTINEDDFGLFTSDLAEMPSGHLLGLYGSTIIEIDPENPGEVLGWDMGEFGYLTIYLVAAAYLGESTIHDTIAVEYDEDGYPVEFEEGDWDVHIYALIDVYGGVFYFAFTDEGDAWLDLYGETDYESEELWYSSAVYAYNEDGKPTLFWSYYTGESSQLIAISLDGDYEDDLTCTVLGDMGEFGDDAWPVVGLMSADTPELPASVSAVLNSGRMQQMSAAQTVRKIGDEAKTVSEPEHNSKEPAGTAVVTYGKAAAPAALSLTANSSADEPSTYSLDVKAALDLNLNASSTNGLIKVEYDAQALELAGVDGNAVLNSVNDKEDGVVVYAYAYKSAKAAGTTVATLNFISRTAASTTVTVTTLERGTDVLEDVEKVRIKMDVSIPADPGPFQPIIPTTPTQPTTSDTIPVISVPPAPTPEKAEELIAPYTDLQSGKWYSDYAAYMIDSGLMLGISATDFAPNAPLTRGMLVTILYRAAGQPAAGGVSFSDVPAGKWYTNGVAWAASNGLVIGRSEEIFDPNGNITRQELAVILWRFAQAMGLSVSTNGMTMPDFADRDKIADWAGEAMAWAYHSGIINGRDSSHLAPNDGASRIETAAMVVRFLKLVENSQSPSV